MHEAETTDWLQKINCIDNGESQCASKNPKYDARAPEKFTLSS